MSTNKFSVSDIVDFIYNKATKEERAYISSAIRAVYQEEVEEARDSFCIGDKVKFSPRKRGYPSVITGTVFKKNRKTIHVMPSDGGRPWRVTASLLKKA